MRRNVLLVLPGLLAVVLALPTACSSQGGTTTGSGGNGTTSSSGSSTSTTGSTSTSSSSSSTASSSSSSSTTTSSSSSTTTSSSSSSSSTTSSGTVVDSGIAHPCDLPGSVQFTASGTVTVPGGPTNQPSLAFLHLPQGFCAHYFATVGNVRQLRFAPSGELFVASPTGLTTGGGQGGQNAIFVLPDADKDGFADAPITYLGNLPRTQGLLFTGGYFYYQDDVKIMRVPYQVGDHAPSGAATQVANITYYSSALHWPKALDVADDGTIYVGNGGDQGESCDPSHPFHGGIRKIDGTPDGAPVARGFRNPIAVRCAKGHNQCFALELAKDYTYGMGGREKMVPLRAGDDWGFPCCATKNLAYPDAQPAPPAGNCASVVAEDVGFYIGDTPFGFDFAPATWPGMWAGRAMVANHGAAGSWTGARIVAVAMDPTTGLPLPSSNAAGNGNTGGMVDFATGWDDHTTSHGRPASVEFSPDGRMFVGNDNNGIIVWIAPLDM